MTTTSSTPTLDLMDAYERVWRAFGENEISRSAAHYLLAIASLESSGPPPRAVDVALRLEVSRAAVSLQLKVLKASGLIEVGDDHRIRLTPAAGELVARIASKREIVRAFLADLLGVSTGTAERDACKVEHLISEEAAAALVRLLRFVDSGHDSATRFVAAFRELTAECPPGVRCELCKGTCLIRSALSRSRDEAVPRRSR